MLLLLLLLLQITSRLLPTQCTPPGLIYARAGELRAANKVLVLQVSFGTLGATLAVP